MAMMYRSVKSKTIPDHVSASQASSEENDISAFQQCLSMTNKLKSEFIFRCEMHIKATRITSSSPHDPNGYLIATVFMPIKVTRDKQSIAEICHQLMRAGGFPNLRPLTIKVSWKLPLGANINGYNALFHVSQLTQIIAVYPNLTVLHFISNQKNVIVTFSSSSSQHRLMITRLTLDTPSEIISNRKFFEKHGRGIKKLHIGVLFVDKKFKDSLSSVNYVLHGSSIAETDDMLNSFQLPIPRYHFIECTLFGKTRIIWNHEQHCRCVRVIAYSNQEKIPQVRHDGG
ncbi:hypothetical protein BDA99DRAFT_533876 [Phascolomyces articulosus]|uniref:Uncharacterized protein n=1 Tax=Phascolomyces articulosus TaxID=60185 RepID=A0AAD5K803_9FUNG|nr:hypothetical protein BDA99DRAFT_533876 [Phascolomyces articulosus]